MFAARRSTNTPEMREAAGQARGRVKELLEKNLKMLSNCNFLPQVLTHSAAATSPPSQKPPRASTVSVISSAAGSIHPLAATA